MKHSTSGLMFYVTNGYGPSSWEGEEEFCNELVALKRVCGDLRVMCGDFNLTKNLQEQRSRSWCGRLITMFTDLLNDLGMIDLPMKNQNVYVVKHANNSYSCQARSFPNLH